MSNDKQTAVMTPVFEGTQYVHHICSECKGTIKLRQSCYGGVSFYGIFDARSEEIKFCPLCGSEIIRFSDKPIYEKPIDLTPLDVFGALHREYERKARWLYHCYISDSHRNKIEALIPLINSGDISVYYKDALKIAREGRFTYGQLTATKIRKLREEFGKETE